ncbi:MAG TPA: hypothetical protein VGB07_36320 [Blastocatellia bacterium]
MLRKDLKAKLRAAGHSRAARGLTRVFIGDEVWDYRTGCTSLACVNPLTGESFGLLIGGLDLSDSTAVKKAILRKACELKQSRAGTSTKEVTITQNLFTT